MIDSIVKAGWMNLRRDRAALVLSFIVPIVFFSIFATVFGQRDSGTAKIKLAVADEDRSERSKELIAGFKSETALTIIEAPKDGPAFTAASGFVNEARSKSVSQEAASGTGMRQACP